MIFFSKFKCLLCDKVVTMEKTSNDGTYDLWQHFAQDHPTELEKIRDSDNQSIDEDQDDYQGDDRLEDTAELQLQGTGKKIRRMKNKRSKAWLYFNLVEDGMAKCRKCNFVLHMETGSTSSLIYHLKVVHPDLFNKHNFKKDDPQPNQGDENANADDAGGGKRKNVKKIKKELPHAKGKKSKIWNFFTVEDHISQCKSCDFSLQVEKGCISKLIFHLRSNHPDKLEQYDNLCKSDKELCEICSFQVNPGGMVQHTFTDHYQTWAKSATLKLEKLMQQLEVNWQASVSCKSVLPMFYQLEKDSMLQCNVCQVVVDSDFLSMEQHCKNEHSSTTQGSPPIPVFLYYTPEDQTCLLCSAKGVPESNLVEHLTEKHRIEHDDLVRWGEALREPRDSLTFQTALLLEKHDSLLNDTVLKKDRLRPKESRTDDPAFRTCMQCRKVFSSSSAMRYHVKVVHTGAKPFQCSICEKSFSRKDTMESHVLSHSNLRPFMCSICGKQFGRRHVRDTHERSHRDDRRYVCQLCPKRFMSSQLLRNHVRTHTGEKPFSCEHCGKMFAQKHQLTTHFRTHTGERPYSCKMCTQRFKHLSTKRNHKCAGELKPLERGFLAFV